MCNLLQIQLKYIVYIVMIVLTLMKWYLFYMNKICIVNNLFIIN